MTNHRRKRINKRGPFWIVGLATVSISCGASTEAVPTAPTSTSIATGFESTDSVVVTRPAPSTVTETSATAAPLTSPDVPETAPAFDPARAGEELGFGSIGPRINLPQPWPLDTIYTDLEPGALVVEFAPPDQDCIAAQATATIGRGGAILVSLWVEGDRDGEACADDTGINRVSVALREPIDGRRIYTSTVAETGGASAAAEAFADLIIGLTGQEAIDAARDAGFDVRDMTNVDAVDSDFNPARINVSTTNGIVVFAVVY
ncbi:MAG: hypothetical protein AB8G14_00045 [Ilumatobacter sp.]